MQPCKLICKNPGDEALQIWHKGETGSGLGGLGGGGEEDLRDPTQHSSCLSRKEPKYVCWKVLDSGYRETVY